MNFSEGYEVSRVLKIFVTSKDLGTLEVRGDSESFKTPGSSGDLGGFGRFWEVQASVAPDF